MTKFRFDYYNGNQSLGSTFKDFEGTDYQAALDCAKLRINDDCDKIRVCFGDNFEGYFEVK